MATTKSSVKNSSAAKRGPATKGKAAATKGTAAAKAKTSAKAEGAPAAKPPAASKKAKAAAGAEVSPEQRRNYIEVAAFYIAERRGFAGNPLDDWSEAEAEIDRLLAEGLLGG